MSTFTFQKASKSQLKARVAVSGPAGAGKTTAALTLATELVGKDGSIAVIDTERGSASLYADRFDFLTLDFAPPYDPRRLVEAIDAAERAGVECLIVDSLSHFWSGEGGILEQVDNASGASKFTSGWKEATPRQNRMIEKILSFPGHVIVTLRSKTAYAVDGSGGKAIPRKVGQAPVQRDGVEYEFALVLDLDRDHSIGISKTRCAELETTALLPASDLHRVIATFIAWLGEGDRATTSPLAAKRRLVQTFFDRGWDELTGKKQAAALWESSGIDGDRIDVEALDELCKQVPVAPREDDTFAPVEEEA